MAGDKNRGALTARIFGGLGNQMFIYATARACALRLNVPLYLDIISGFQNDPYQRKWSLQHFNIQYQQADAFRRLGFPGGKIVRKLLKITNKKGLFHNFITESNPENFDNYILQIPEITGNVWLEGYWQSPRYFDAASSVIRADFELTTPLSMSANEVLSQIKQTNAVGLHARRLRNVLVGEEAAKIKSLSLDYYHKAIQAAGEQIKNPHFFCFSDDPEWLKTHLEIPFPHTMVTFNQGSDDRNYEDFALLASCRHFIISNSTYAWWAAWLGNYSEKKVFAPGVRFWDCKDILVPEWQIIE